MRCPYCLNEDLKVTDSRDTPDSNAIRRRRECQNCSKRFTTFETIELSLQVHKRDGRFEEFQKSKLLNGITASCRHTTVSQDQVGVLVDRIISEIMDGHMSSITTKDLGDMVMRYLQQLDPVAYIRYACVYRRFKRLDELKEAIESIPAKDEPAKEKTSV